jgi:hypothetical protein
MEIVIYLDEQRKKNETILLERVYSEKEIYQILDEKYGKWGWYSYNILI